ncbi:MAG TPA: AraC family transcriptional regulator [Dysgonamonadaceae bacterium]|jgi:AraC-like DNA-binding protein|nr:helix-turn-helix transcriptional regulator [Bacteroidales bacterium]HXL00841.1 AraC family transcriptional regulator [Dysgonamonadaceae bacterium]
MKADDSTDSSVVYTNVSECIVRFADGEQKIISSQKSGDLLIVYIMEYKLEELSFVESVLKNYRSSKTVDDLSVRCGYRSTKTFTRHFKKNFDTTPKQWLLMMKKNEVIYYLKNTDYTLKKIAALLGFSSVSHLWDFCIKKVGMNPTEIRSQKD